MKLLEDISSKTGIPIKSLNWLNNDEWFHGTTIMDAQNIMLNKVDALYNVGKGSDYGPGFYMTRTLQEAESYISKLPIVDSKNGRLRKRKSWAILKFEFNPFELLFMNDNNYTYKNFHKFNEEFGRFAMHNWLFNTNNEHPHGYDIVWGVMSDSIPDQIVSNYQTGVISYNDAVKAFQKNTSMKQICIGNSQICSLLEPIYEKEVK